MLHAPALVADVGHAPTGVQFKREDPGRPVRAPGPPPSAAWYAPAAGLLRAAVVRPVRDADEIG
eukprot:5304340-Lingulodinium_polyedra.AAC.1